VVAKRQPLDIAHRDPGMVGALDHAGRQVDPHGDQVALSQQSERSTVAAPGVEHDVAVVGVDQVHRPRVEVQPGLRP